MRRLLTCLVIGCFVLSLGIVMADQAKLIASKNSDKYHLETCATAQKIDAANKIVFNTPEDAIKAGYSPCKVCNPPTKSAAFVASNSSDKYHLPTCAMAAKITSENKITFASKEEAEKAGYKPCQICCKSK